jgi:hypothetical protein
MDTLDQPSHGIARSPRQLALLALSMPSPQQQQGTPTGCKVLLQAVTSGRRSLKADLAASALRTSTSSSSSHNSACQEHSRLLCRKLQASRQALAS